MQKEFDKLSEELSKNHIRLNAEVKKKYSAKEMSVEEVGIELIEKYIGSIFTLYGAKCIDSHEFVLRTVLYILKREKQVIKDCAESIDEYTNFKLNKIIKVLNKTSMKVGNKDLKIWSDTLEYAIEIIKKEITKKD